MQAIEPRQLAPRLDAQHLRLKVPGHLLHDVDRSPVQPFRLHIVAPVLVHPRQGIQDVGDIGMVRAGLRFEGRKRLPGSGCGLFIQALGAKGDGELVEPTGLLKGLRSHVLSLGWLGWLTVFVVVFRRL